MSVVPRIVDGRPDADLVRRHGVQELPRRVVDALRVALPTRVAHHDVVAVRHLVQMDRVVAPLTDVPNERQTDILRQPSPRARTYERGFLVLTCVHGIQRYEGVVLCKTRWHRMRMFSSVRGERV